MSWFADLAGKAEHLLNNLDEQTGVALRNHNVTKLQKKDRTEYSPRPERGWNQPVRKKPLARSPRRLSVEARPSYVPSGKLSPTSSPNPQTQSQSRSFNKNGPQPQAKKPQFNLHHCPKTLVGDMKEGDGFKGHYGFKPSKRSKSIIYFNFSLLLSLLLSIDDTHYQFTGFSLPNDLEAASTEDSLSIKMENLEVENSVLKNELNVTNREVTELLERLRKTEDGENVVSCREGNSVLKLICI